MEAYAEHLHGAQHHGLRAHLGSDEPVEALAALFAEIEIAVRVASTHGFRQRR